jgi:hypothetical protein
MNISSIGLYSDENEIANFDFVDPMSDNPYIAKSILGLDAEEIVPKFYGFSKVNRDRMYDFAMKPRDVVFKIGLNPHRNNGESFSTLRDNLYRAVSASRTGQIDIRFNTGIPWYAYIRGFITKFEVPLFSKTPEVQLTLNCEDPIIRGFNASRFLADSSPSGLEPFVVVDADSTAPHGMEVQVHITSELYTYSIIDSLAIGSDPDWEFKIDYHFLAGDVLNVNSQTGVRSITVTRGTDILQIADKIAPESVWPVIFPGTNNVTFSNPDSTSLEYLEFTAEFWGV